MKLQFPRTKPLVRGKPVRSLCKLDFFHCSEDYAPSHCLTQFVCSLEFWLLFRATIKIERNFFKKTQYLFQSSLWNFRRKKKTKTNRPEVDSETTRNTIYLQLCKPKAHSHVLVHIWMLSNKSSARFDWNQRENPMWGIYLPKRFRNPRPELASHFAVTRGWPGALRAAIRHLIMYLTFKIVNRTYQHRQAALATKD